MLLKITLALYLAAAVVGVSRVHAQEQPSSNTQNSPDTVPLFKMGQGITAPRAIYQPEPEFSDQARAAHYQGTCVLSIVVGEDGKPRDIKVTTPLGMGLDEKAVEAVSKWQFEPARKDGTPVPVRVLVEVDFHSYGKDDLKIAQLMKQAASGDAKAELELSEAYFKGQGIGKDDAKGLMYLRRAARHGLPRAQFLMGEHITHESDPDNMKAYMWYTLAKRGGEKHCDKPLKELSAKLTQEEIQTAQSLVDNWQNAPPK
jgi:TonB family protein